MYVHIFLGFFVVYTIRFTCNETLFLGIQYSSPALSLKPAANFLPRSTLLCERVRIVETTEAFLIVYFTCVHLNCYVIFKAFSSLHSTSMFIFVVSDPHIVHTHTKQRKKSRLTEFKERKLSVGARESAPQTGKTAGNRA